MIVRIMEAQKTIHAIRQHLMVVTGRAELLGFAAQTEKDRNSCRAICDAAYAINRLLQDVAQTQFFPEIEVLKPEEKKPVSTSASLTLAG